MVITIYQLKISLDDAHIPIWRRILMPSTVTFRDLHKLMQTAFGWQDCHMHHFVVPTTAGKGRMYIVSKEAEDHLGVDSMPSVLRMAEENTKLADIIPKIATEILYEYDFGDSWSHTVKLEKTLSNENGRKYPACITGENAGPPEDCGGTPGYEHLCCKVLRNPKHKEYREQVEWLGLKSGREFDPHKFNLKGVDAAIRKAQGSEFRIK